MFMNFNVNKEVVEMLEVLASYPSLQILLIVALIILRLPELIKSIKG